ncbi:MAG TPA: SDR family oxidoreductase [Nitrososphaera sp.]|nr:SDR family oxidoreductase [Nitrososphaera sp.]
MTTAIVTGSGRGIGRETAILLAKQGINVVVCSRTTSEINATVEAIKKIHAGVLGVKCDVGISSQVDSLAKKAVEKFGRVDILVNNAGIFTVKKLVDTSEKEWDEILGVNLKGAFLCCKAVLPHMLANNSGAIVNVSSGAGKAGFDSLSAYCVSKFGMMGLTESLAWEVAGHNIRVMAICPGEVATKMQESDPEYYRENLSRMIKPEQVAAKIVDMVFDSKYRNGQSVDI